MSRGPGRKIRASSGESCIEKTKSNTDELRPPPQVLRQRLTVAERDPKESTFKELLRVIGASPYKIDSSLKKDAQLALVREKLVQAMCKSIASSPQKAKPDERRAFIDRMFEFRSDDTQNLHDSLDSSTAQIVDCEKKTLAKTLWLSKVTTSTASLVARTTNTRYKKTEDKQKEQKIRDNEKLPQIIYSVIDELIPTYGVRAMAIFAAMQGR